MDPHIWLSPSLVKTQAAAIAEGLSTVDPDNAAAYAKNLAGFHSELDSLDAEIRSLVQPHAHKSFMVYHPSWGYFAQAYGLKQIPIEAEGKEPGPRELQKLIAYGKEHGVAAIFVQKQFSGKSAKLIAAEIGAEVVELDPLAPAWADNLLNAAKAIAKGAK